MPSDLFGILSGGVFVLTIPALELAKRYMEAHPTFPVPMVLSWFAFGTVIGNLVFVWTGNFYLMLLAFWLSQTLRNATKPLFMAWINRHTSSGVRATVISMYWQSNAFGNIVGLPILGVVGSLTTIRVALTAAAIALLPVVPIYRKHRNEALSSNH